MGLRFRRHHRSWHRRQHAVRSRDEQQQAEEADNRFVLSRVVVGRPGRAVLGTAAALDQGIVRIRHPQYVHSELQTAHLRRLLSHAVRSLAARASLPRAPGGRVHSTSRPSDIYQEERRHPDLGHSSRADGRQRSLLLDAFSGRRNLRCGRAKIRLLRRRRLVLVGLRLGVARSVRGHPRAELRHHHAGRTTGAETPKEQNGRQRQEDERDDRFVDND